MVVPLALLRSGWPDDQGANGNRGETYRQGLPRDPTVTAAQDSASVGPGVDAVRLIGVPVNGDDHVIIRAWWDKLLPRAATRGGTVELRLLPPGTTGDAQQHQVRFIGRGTDVQRVWALQPMIDELPVLPGMCHCGRAPWRWPRTPSVAVPG